MSKDYYQLLGISKSATEKEIKSAYRRMARKYHPDVNPGNKEAETKFKEVSEAYEVLGNAEKRKLYDQFGSNWEHAQQFKGRGAGSSGGFGDMGGFQFQTSGDDPFGNLFEQFFGSVSGTSAASGKTRQQKRQAKAKASDVEKVVEITLEEVATGTKRSLTYQVMDACKSCDGTGLVALRTERSCSACGGTGKAKGLLGFSQHCSVCGGSGKSSLERCPSCSGSGAIATTRKVEVTIPKGISDRKRLRVPGRGAKGADNRSGDLYVLIHVKPHERFTRLGDDLETTVSVSYLTAILGGEIKIPTLQSTVSMKIPAGTQNNQVFRLSNQGLPRLANGKGNLMARIHIEVPKEVSKKEQKLLTDLQKLQESNDGA